MTEEKIKAMEESFFKELETLAKKHKDIRALLETYKNIKEQETFSEEFLKGYISCISDLRYVKLRR